MLHVSSLDLLHVCSSITAPLTGLAYTPQHFQCILGTHFLMLPLQRAFSVQKHFHLHVDSLLIYCNSQNEPCIRGGLRLWILAAIDMATSWLAKCTLRSLPPLHPKVCPLPFSAPLNPETVVL